MTNADPTLAQEISAAMEWWKAAGVDHDFADDATAWLADASILDGERPADEAARNPNSSAVQQSVPSQGREPTGSSRADLLGDSPPESLEQFKEFWLSAPGLDGIGPRGRIPPRGKAGATVMVFVVEPEEGDTQTLLAGSQGRLLARMLNAMGVSEDETYFASALPRQTPMADTAAIAAGGMDAVTACHIKLAAPERVLAFGGNILPLIGHELPKDPLSLREINLVNPPKPLLVSEGLDSLMAMPRLKARFWRRWIEWSAGR
ncbi:MAG: hypothetical protein QNJ15_10000 [Erythrobacter sp.]|nr:hypothetical protein [Erythrobacter sp.]